MLNGWVRRQRIRACLVGSALLGRPAQTVNIVSGWIIATLLHLGEEGGAEALGYEWPPIYEVEER